MSGKPYIRNSGPATTGKGNDDDDEEIKGHIDFSRETTRLKDKIESQDKFIQTLNQKLEMSEKQLEATEQFYLEREKRSREQDILEEESNHRNAQESMEGLEYRQQELDERQQELDERQQELDQRQQNLAGHEQDLDQRRKSFNERRKLSNKLYFGLYLSVLVSYDSVEKYKKRQCTKILFEETTQGYGRETVTYSGLGSLQSELAMGEAGYSSNSDTDNVEENVQEYAAEAIGHGQSQSLQDELTMQTTECSSDSEKDMDDYAEDTTRREDSSHPPNQTGQVDAYPDITYREDSPRLLSLTGQVNAAPQGIPEGYTSEHTEKNYVGNKPFHEITAGAGSIIFGKREWALLVSWINGCRTLVCSWDAAGAFRYFAVVSAVIQLIFWILCIYLIRAARLSSSKSGEELELWSLANGLTREYLLQHALIGDVD